jgi:hypothetical protein
MSPSSLQKYRLACYRQMMLEDLSDDYAIQDYQSDWHHAQDEVKRLFAYLDTHHLSSEQEAEILLTIFVALQIGYRNWELFQRAADHTYDLLPHLSDSKLKCHLLVHLYQETQDEDLLPEIDQLMDTWTEATMTEEDHYLQALYEPQFQ